LLLCSEIELEDVVFDVIALCSFLLLFFENSFVALSLFMLDLFFEAGVQKREIDYFWLFLK